MYWQEGEIQKLQQSFLKGFSLKKMARLLNKSPGAVNKALTRFHIRPKKSPNQPIWSIHMKQKKPNRTHDRIVICSLKDTSVWRSTGINLVQRAQEKQWVSLKDVMQFLQECGESVTVHQQHGKLTYRIDHHILSPAQLLIRANRYRSERNMKCYGVEDIMDSTNHPYATKRRLTHPHSHIR